MSAGFEVLLVLVIFLGLLAAGMAIPFAIGVPAIVYLLVHGGVPALRGIGLMSWGSMNSFALTAIPLFILMAEIMQHSGLSFRIYRGLSKLVCVIPGGLLQTNIAGCALFAAISGSSVATAAAIGTVALPQLIQRGYHRPLAAGSLAAGGTLGILIPPSIAMIVYGTFTETSVSKLFMAGIVPGLVLTALFMAYVLVHALLRPEIAPREKGPQNLAEFVVALSDLLPFVVVIGGTMGSLYFGWATPTEAAAIGCLAGVVVSAIWGKLGWQELKAAMISSVMISGNILLIVYTAFVFSYAISVAGVGEQLTTWMVGLNLSRLEFFFALFILYTDPGLPGRKPGHDRDHRAAALSGAAEIRHRSGVVRHHPGAVHRARADLAAHRHQPVRDPEHLGRQAVRHRLGHDPVPSPDVRPADRCWYSGPRSRCGCPIT